MTVMVSTGNVSKNNCYISGNVRYRLPAQDNRDGISYKVDFDRLARGTDCLFASSLLL